MQPEPVPIQIRESDRPIDIHDDYPIRFHNDERDQHLYIQPREDDKVQDVVDLIDGR